MTIMSVYYFFPVFSLLCGLWAFVGTRSHLLNTLLSLEYIVVSIFWFIVVMLVDLGVDTFFSLFFLTVTACEGALGLALLVSMVRSHGSDKFSSFSALRC